MDDILLLDTVERYLRGELNTQERDRFEKLRKETPEIDQLVVEHSMFLHQIDMFGENRNFKHLLQDIHTSLSASGEINDGVPTTSGKVVYFWNKYKRVTAIAASIAGITALCISMLVSYLTPTTNKEALVMLNRKMDQVMHNVKVQDTKLNVVLQSKAPINEKALNGGSSFLIDGKGYLITNAHVVKGSSSILVENNKGQEFKAEIVHTDNVRDLAILKITDEDYKPLATLPYGLKRNTVELGEQIFTLGYPRDEIVYNEGYMSAKTGFNGDTISCQIAVSANPGNSGGPVFNKNGELIGIVSTAQRKAEGVVFAIKSKEVEQAIDDFRNGDTSYLKVKMATASNIRGIDRVQQIKQIQDCIYMVKSFSK